MESIDVTHFIQQFPNETQEIMKTIRTMVHEICPECTELMAYGIPTFDHRKQHMIHISAYPKHLGVYPGADGIEAFKHRFEGLKYAKGSVQFPLSKPIPYDLIKDMIEYRKKACEE